MIIFRRIAASVLATLLVALFTVAMAATFVARAASDEQFVPSLLEDADAYGFVYDSLLDAAIRDATTNGVDFEGGDGSTYRIQFDDPDRAAAALRTFIETVLPREYVKREVDEAFAAVVPYVTGRTDTFAVDLDTGSRIMAVPAAISALAPEIGLGEIISRDVVAVIVRERMDELALDTIGITVTPEEAVDAAYRVIPPDWIEQRIVDAAAAVAPYLAGESDGFTVNIPLDGRAEVLGQVLKDKLAASDTVARNLFDQVAGPIVTSAVGTVRVLSFRVELTPAEIESALQKVAPADWLRVQGSRAIDEVVRYVASDTETLSLSIDLADRKKAALPVLHDLARQKLTAIVASVPACATQADAALALGDVSASRMPRCAPASLDRSLVVAALQPFVNADIDRTVASSVPDRVTYTDADFRAALGPGASQTLTDVRNRLREGISFTDQDLRDGLAGDGPADGQGALDFLETVRAGAKWDQDDLLAELTTPEARDAFETARRTGAFITPLKALAIALPVLLAVAIGFLGGRSWPGRLIWAGGSLLAAALLFIATVEITSGRLQDIARTELNRHEFVDFEFRRDFPATAAMIESPETKDRAFAFASVLGDRLRNTAVPWAVAAGLVTVGGVALWAWPKSGQARHEQAPPASSGPGAPAGPAPQAGATPAVAPSSETPTSAPQPVGSPDNPVHPDSVPPGQAGGAASQAA
jgi:hypothetical protein